MLTKAITFWGLRVQHFLKTPSQSSVVRITSLYKGSPSVQFNSQLGLCSRLPVSTDVPVAWHMGFHAHAHTVPRRGAAQRNSLTSDSGEFACVCRHGNMYVLHDMLTKPRRKSEGMWGISGAYLSSLSNPRYNRTAWALTNISWAPSRTWFTTSHREADIYFLSTCQPHCGKVVVWYCTYWISLKK